MQRRIVFAIVAIALLVGMAVPAMAITWKNYNNRTIGAGSSLVPTGTATKEKLDFSYATVQNTHTYAQHNPTYGMQVTMQLLAGSSGSSVASNSVIVFDGNTKNSSYKAGYGAAGTVYRLRVFNDSAYAVTSTGSWTPN